MTKTYLSDTDELSDLCMELIGMVSDAYVPRAAQIANRLQEMRESSVDWGTKMRELAAARMECARIDMENERLAEREAKREKMAMHVLCGLLANPLPKLSDRDEDSLASLAVMHADALLAELEKGE